MKKILCLISLGVTLHQAQALPLIINETGRGTYFGTKSTQACAFFGATPVVQQSTTTDLVTALIAYGLLPTGSTGVLKGDHILQSGTAAPTAVGTLRVSGTNLLLWTGTTWITK